MGQFFCTVTGRDFESRVALERHQTTKAYKKQLRALTQGKPPHTQSDAEEAAGMGKPDNGKG